MPIDILLLDPDIIILVVGLLPLCIGKTLRYIYFIGGLTLGHMVRTPHILYSVLGESVAHALDLLQRNFDSVALCVFLFPIGFTRGSLMATSLFFTFFLDMLVRLLLFVLRAII